MTILPIVSRELRVASRLRSTYWVRTGAALLVMVIGIWFFLMMQREQAQKEMAMVLFGILTGACVLYCALAGMRFTADCLSEEKREGTLGLLFLTDLKGYDVIFGKLMATSLGAFYGVLAVVPVLAVPLLMGGVTLGEFGRMALVCINTLFFSLALGMFCSSINRSARKSMTLTFLLLLLVTALLPALGAWMAFLAKTRRIQEPLVILSAGHTYYLAWDAMYKGRSEEFWRSLLVMHGTGWMLLALAAVITPRSWQDRPAGAYRLRWRERWRLWSYGDAGERARFRERLLDANAFFWLAARARLKPACVWAVLGVVGCGWALGIAKFHRDWFMQGTYIMTGLLLSTIMKMWFASEVGRQLAEDRKSGALELLLSTAMTVRDILRGQLLALMRQFLGPLLVVLVAGGLFMLGSLSDTEAVKEDPLWLSIWLGGMVMLVADLAALYWVGIWQGISAKNPTRAVGTSLTRILILPTVAYAVVMLVASMISMSGARTGRYDPITWKFSLGCWFGLGLAADIGFGARARHKLLTEFRLAAGERYLAGPGFWKRLFMGSQPAASSAPPVIAGRV
jgi:ABC-type Na+ efflux pump permease subunit